MIDYSQFQPICCGFQGNLTDQEGSCATDTSSDSENADEGSYASDTSTDNKNADNIVDLTMILEIFEFDLGGIQFYF